MKGMKMTRLKLAQALKTLTVVAGACALGGVFTLPVVHAADAPKAPTFTKDVAPIFQEKCEACHRPDSIAPMSLVTFADVALYRSRARSRRASATTRCRHGKSTGPLVFRNSRTTARSPTNR